MTSPVSDAVFLTNEVYSRLKAPPKWDFNAWLYADAIQIWRESPSGIPLQKALERAMEQDLGPESEEESLLTRNFHPDTAEHQKDHFCSFAHRMLEARAHLQQLQRDTLAAGRFFTKEEAEKFAQAIHTLDTMQRGADMFADDRIRILLKKKLERQQEILDAMKQTAEEQEQAEIATISKPSPEMAQQQMIHAAATVRYWQVHLRWAAKRAAVRKAYKNCPKEPKQTKAPELESAEPVVQAMQLKPHAEVAPAAQQLPPKPRKVKKLHARPVSLYKNAEEVDAAVAVILKQPEEKQDRKQLRWLMKQYVRLADK
ncbi:uncharacterized protein LOC129582908 [Paramacrobiotus metropolitanus]|uniref:uncharacterized protein LOC129582908 n=1 Tax=Paramacrobiotus metropolitanus TaxID=2943436 RepID=UPI00244607E3|nr:uncharacterized protein LOC129582908 [Paramacrobiotus metropolitanus]